ncbi:flagellar biosynthetic protein FlhB [Jezberella montanilacus]|uniref:Flagellar biosynthetic protein FlhB n=1 Tax=Jezberella montanilacus TaxID=323426 RepID=A0A2T0XL79_9BURK|nr:flagellar biosynthesis protein FlhB [Jezberella montanilacus]PRY99709.1 flagellar biosynthetic protein FlhB [Jezberella montanilacus]
MAEDSDLERSEQASQTRLDKAREEGDVPRSRDLSTFVTLICAATGMAVFGSQMGNAIQTTLTGSLTFDRTALYDTTIPLNQMAKQVADLLLAFAPFALLMLIAALGCPLLIGGWNVSFTHLTPNFGKLNPMEGLKNMVSQRSLVELIKSILKTLVIGVIAYLVIAKDFPVMLTLSSLAVDEGITKTKDLLLNGFFYTVSGIALIALIDAPYQMFAYAEKLKMSKEELTRESKEQNGNPQIKARIRRQQREMARRRMMSEIPNADVIITNPTHYAVAIRYDEQTMQAPRVVAMGVDEMALRIRAIGREHEVLIMESPKLARALFTHSELGDEIPQALYIAVAEILAYVFQLRNFRPGMGSYPIAPSYVDVPDELDPLLASIEQGRAS